MRIGYVRVSTIEQNEARQMELMSVNKAEKIFMDKASGKSVEGRQAFCEMMDFVRSGDTVITESISRIARNTRDLLSIVATLTEKNVEFAFRQSKHSYQLFAALQNVIFHHFYHLPQV